MVAYIIDKHKARKFGQYRYEYMYVSFSSVCVFPPQKSQLERKSKRFHKKYMQLNIRVYML